jgi:hypothetical protein
LFIGKITYSNLGVIANVCEIQRILLLAMNFVSKQKNLGFIGISSILGDTLKEYLLDLDYDVLDIDSFKDDSLSDFSGVIIADLTQFENNLDTILGKVKHLENDVELYLIHSYAKLPTNVQSTKMNWIHTDKIVDELIPKLMS